MITALIVAQLALGVARTVTVSSPAPRTPIVTQVWRASSPGTPLGYFYPNEGTSLDGETAYFSGPNGIVGILVASGEPTSEKLHPIAHYRWRLYLDRSLIVGEGRSKFQVIWNSPKQRIGYQVPRETNFTLVQLGPKSTEVRSTCSFTDSLIYGSIIGNPDDGIWVLQTVTSLEQAQPDLTSDEVDFLFLPHLRLSPLTFDYIYDVSRPKSVLGETFPVGTTRSKVLQLIQKMDIHSTTHVGLACGNAYTGKILWQNRNFRKGYWVGKWVLALNRGRWSVLDGATGKIILRRIPNLDQKVTGYALLAIEGPYVLMEATHLGTTSLKCVKFSLTTAKHNLQTTN